MSDQCRIEWCDATINPAYGCTPVSPACDNCYAARMAGRLGALTEGTHKDGKWTGRINLFQERMEQALRWRKPRRIFVGSMTDLFHESVPDSFLDRVFAAMAVAPQHTFILLTKRPERMLGYLRYTARQFYIASEATWFYAHRVKQAPFVHESGPSMLWPLANIILMTTVEDQPRADERMPHLMALAGMGWKTGVSIEPMLGAVDLDYIYPASSKEPSKTCGTPWGHKISALHGTVSTGPGGPSAGRCEYGRLSWVIVGGESGPDARPMHPDWARGLRDQCQAAGVPYFFKQWGEWGFDPRTIDAGGPLFHRFSDGVIVERVGKHRAGRLLDGVEHNEFPEVRHG